ncbi:hypothetical protein Tco_0158586 [Tanacetum coccineum]
MANDDPILTYYEGFFHLHEVVQKTYYAFCYGGKKKQPAKGLETLSEIAFSEAEQMKLAIKRSKTQLHSSQPSGSGAHEGTGITQVVPILSTHDDEARKDDEVNEEENNEESNDESNKESDKEVLGPNTKEEEMDKEATHEEDKANELYRDVNVNLEGRDIVMIDAPLPNVQATQEIEDTHLILTASIHPEGYKVTSLFLTLMRDDEDKDEEPSAGSNRGSKRRRAGKEPESTSAPKEKTSKTTGKSTDGSKSQHKSASESAHIEEPMHTAHTEEPMHTDKDLEEPAHHEFDIRATEEQSDEETSQHPDGFKNHNLAREEGPRESFDELMDTPLDFSVFMMNRLKINTPTPELLAGLTFELMKGQQYPHDLRKPLLLIPDKSFHLITSSTTTLCIYLVVSPVVLMKLLSQRPRLQIKVISNGLKIWSPTQSGMNCRDSLVMCTPNEESLPVTKLQIVECKATKHLVDHLWQISMYEIILRLGVSLECIINKYLSSKACRRLQLGVKVTKELNIPKARYVQESDPQMPGIPIQHIQSRGFIYQTKDKKNN